MLAATIDQGHIDRKHKLWNGIKIERYISHTGDLGLLLPINGQFTNGKQK